MKKLLLQLDTDRLASVFDAVAAYDAGVDHVLPYAGVTAEDARNLVYGITFARAPADLKHAAIFVGGSDVAAGEQILKAVTGAYFGPFRASAMLDANGTNTTAAAAVAKINGVLPLAGQRALVLGGTGPVGLRVAALLDREGCRVRLASRSFDRARAAVEQIRNRFGGEATPCQVHGETGLHKALTDVDLLIAAGAPGAQLLPRNVWGEEVDLAVMVDLNGVAPAGIEGVEPNDDGVDRDGKRTFGPIAVGALRTSIFRACIARLFDRNDLVLDVEQIYEIARSL